MKRFSSNITGLSPVTKKTSPTKVNQEKAKVGAKQEQPWIFQGVKKTYKQQQNTKNNNYKQQLITNKIYSSAVSSMGPPLSLPKGERKREQESVAETSVATDSIKLYVDDRQCRSMTSKIVNAPARNNRGIDKENKGPTATVTGSLFQTPVTLAAANLGSCDKNPCMAYTTMDTGAIFGKKRQLKEVRSEWRRRKKRSGGIRPTAGKHQKKLKN
jgi:hypothetical protein